MSKLKELIKRAMPEEKKANAKKDIFAYYVGRPITYILSLPFLDTNISPNAITIFSFVFVILGAVFTSIPGSVYFLLIGWIAYFIWALLDGVDGNVARYRQQFSKIGSVLDAMGGYLAMYFTFFSYGIAAYNYPGWLTNWVSNNLGITSLIFVILGSISGFSLIFPRLIMHKLKSSTSNSETKIEDIQQKSNYNFIKTFVLNITSITGFIEVFMLAICILAIFKIYLFDIFTIIYALINFLFMFVSLIKLLRE